MDISMIIEIVVLIAIGIELFTLYLHSKLDRRIDDHITNTNQHLEESDKIMVKLEQDLKNFDEHITKLDKHMNNLDSHVERLNEQIHTFDEHMNTLDEHMNRLEQVLIEHNHKETK